ncbi:MAG: tRNA (adenosine(37)-N6)-dimethylallyltransferase MiaA [Bacillota bacterium]
MIIVIVGPTGVGKTALSIALAKHYNSEIISGDSVQVYQELNIGSAKIKNKDMDAIPHHMIDILLPNESFSVADYQARVRAKINELQAKNITPILVGGTGFYIKSVLHDFSFDQAHRPDSYDAYYSDLSNDLLHEKLQETDPKSANAIHKNNRKRVLQALYRAEQGVKRSDQDSHNDPVYDYLMIGLTLDRETLYERINHRVDTMFDKGLIEEVKTLYQTYGETQSLEAIGYKELIGYFKGYYDLDTAKTLIKTKSRQYAKKQFTYFKNQFDVQWLTVNIDNFKETIDKAIKIIEGNSKINHKKERIKP